MFINIVGFYFIIKWNLLVVSSFNLGDELDIKIPFVSSLEPKFPRLYRRKFELRPVEIQLDTRYSIHKITIRFYNCTEYHYWQESERLIISAHKDFPASIYIVYDQTIVKTKCIIVNYLKVSFNLHGYPLMVIYEKNYKQIIEQSYGINFQFGDLELNFDKLFYKTFDEIKIRCSLITPWKYLFDDYLRILPSSSNLTILSERYLYDSYVLEIVGKINPQVYQLNITCKFSDIFITEPVALYVNHGYKFITIINYSALSICLAFILVVFIFLGIYTLIIGKKRRLSNDVTAFFTEYVEDRTIRFCDPILNNLTSPKRNYAVPGSHTALLLRKNFSQLFSKLLSIYPKLEIPTFHGDTALLEMEKEKRRRIIEKYNPLLTSSLGCRVIQGLGPMPKKTPVYLAPPFPDLPPIATNLPQEKLPFPDVDSEEPLDRHTISGLPYIKIVQTQNSPCWKVKDATVPIQYGVTYNEMLND